MKGYSTGSPQISPDEEPIIVICQFKVIRTGSLKKPGGSHLKACNSRTYSFISRWSPLSPFSTFFCLVLLNVGVMRGFSLPTLTYLNGLVVFYEILYSQCSCRMMRRCEDGKSAENGVPVGDIKVETMD